MKRIFFFLSIQVPWEGQQGQRTTEDALPKDGPEILQ
jgi:hypothetical protein